MRRERGNIAIARVDPLPLRLRRACATKGRAHHDMRGRPRRWYQAEAINKSAWLRKTAWSQPFPPLETGLSDDRKLSPTFHLTAI